MTETTKTSYSEELALIRLKEIWKEQYDKGYQDSCKGNKPQNRSRSYIDGYEQGIVERARCVIAKTPEYQKLKTFYEAHH